MFFKFLVLYFLSHGKYKKRFHITITFLANSDYFFHNFLFQDFTPTERDGRGGVGAFIGYKDNTPTELIDKQFASIQTVNHLLSTIDHRLLTIYPQNLVDHRDVFHSESGGGVYAYIVFGEAGDLHVV